MRKLLGMVMSATLTLVFMVTAWKGLSIVMVCEALFLTGVVSSMVPITPGGVDLKCT